MGLLDLLPTVEKCCCCIPLKIGCYLIGIIFLCSGSAMAGDNLSSEAFKSGAKCNHIAIPFIAGGILGCIICFFAILYLIGLCMEKPTLATLFAYVMLIAGVFGIIQAVAYCGCAALSKEECNQFTKGLCGRITGYIVVFILYIYFAAIVKSQKEEM